jgi:hypothetical protein
VDSVKRLYGVYRGVVKNNNDPQNQRRLKLQVQTTGSEVTDWAWPMEPSSIHTEVPIVGQGVWVTYVGGDPEYPVWSGSFGKNQGANKQMFVKPLSDSVSITSVQDVIIINDQSDGTKELDLTDSLIAIANKEASLQTTLVNLQSTVANIVQGTGVQGTQGTSGTVGTQGTQGSLGTQGATGTGTQGTQGSAGVQGTIGSQGTTGAGTQGTQGTQGANGTQGIQGTQGVIGSTGAQGTQGSQGATGAQGLQGAQGNLGAQGTEGAQGSQGTQGTQGTLGVQGTQGVTGAQGLQGTQGTQGTKGNTGAGGVIGNYGSFFSSSDQNLNAINTAQVITLNNDYGSNGVSIVDFSKITIATPGTYSMTFVAQVSNSANSVEEITFWLKLNGNDYPNSATTITIFPRKSSDQPSRQLVPVTFVGTSTSENDYVQIYWHGTNTSLSLIHDEAGTAPVHPVTPSIIVGITQVTYQGLQGVQGIQGVQGTTGTQGIISSASEPTIQNVLWLDTTAAAESGPQGTNGAQGIQGTTGSQGTHGVQGTQGVQGTAGTSASDLNAWTAYTPTWASDSGTPSIGNGSITGRYKQIGKTVFFNLKLTYGSTTTGGTGAWMFGLPVTAYNDNYQFAVSILNNGLAWYGAIGNGNYKGSTSYFTVIHQNDTATTVWGGVSSTAPFTFGTGDTVTVSGSYEAV